MSNYILSLNTDNKGNCCAILFDGYNIQTCLHSNIKNFDTFIQNKILPIIELVDNDIILDKNGYGVALRDSLVKHGIRITYSINSSTTTNNLMGVSYEFAVDNLKDIDENEDIDELKIELLNLEVKITNHGKMKFIRKDEDINYTKALCYLQGIAYIRYTKKNRDKNKNDLDYARFIYDHDMQMYDLLSDKEEYLKRQMNQNSNKHSNEIVSEMSKELLSTQSMMLKNVNKLHENFNQWFNIVKNSIENEFDNEEYFRLIKE